MKDTQGEHRDKMVDAYSVCFIGSQIENTSVFCLIRLVKLLHFDMVEPKGLARSAMTICNWILPHSLRSGSE
jgi:hypothetical protein